MRIGSLVSLLPLVAISSAALAAPPIVPAPAPKVATGPWKVEFADSACLLSRPFAADGSTNLVFKPKMLSNDFELVVAEPVGRARKNAYGKVAIALDGKSLSESATFNAYDTAKMRLLRLHVDGSKTPLSALNGQLSVDAAGEAAHRFTISGIQRALPVLTECLDQLRTVYKVTKSDLAGIATEPMGDAKRYFTTDDYPSDALKKNESGTVGALLWVGPDGRVSSCEVVEPAASVSLIAATCEILTRRARYTPGSGIDGKPVRAPTFVRIRWALPG